MLILESLLVFTFFSPIFFLGKTINPRDVHCIISVVHIYACFKWSFALLEHVYITIKKKISIQCFGVRRILRDYGKFAILRAHSGPDVTFKPCAASKKLWVPIQVHRALCTVYTNHAAILQIQIKEHGDSNRTKLSYLSNINEKFTSFYQAFTSNVNYFKRGESRVFLPNIFLKRLRKDVQDYTNTVL